jgi:hypothetical protein
MSSTLSTPISEISDLGDHDRRLIEQAQQQARDYDQVNPYTMSAADLTNLTTETLTRLTPAQRDLMCRVFTPLDQHAPSPSSEEGPMIMPSSPSDYGIDWLFPKGNPTVCDEWAEPTLRVPEVDYEGGDELILAAIGEDQQRFIEELAGGPGPDWLLPIRDVTSPRPPIPRPHIDTEGPMTYESRGVSPVPASDLPTELELQAHIRQYERELQTLYMIQGCPDMQQFVDEVLRENPTIFGDTDLLTLCRTQLDEDPQQEVLQAILTAAALRGPQTTMSSPEPLPVPPPATPSGLAHPPVSELDEYEGTSPAALTPSPMPSPSPTERTRQATEFLEALDAAPRGITRHASLAEPGWHIAPDEDTAMQIPSINR